jgi:hypothetical protein
MLKLVGLDPKCQHRASKRDVEALMREGSHRATDSAFR